uniref:Un-named sa821 n=1 Tax=Cyprinus carpio TaxID=7962 RepID=A0A8C1RRZ5_CYPCA
MSTDMAADQRNEPGIVIEDSWAGYSLELFNYPEHLSIIMNRIECLARDILEDIGHHDLMVLCVLTWWSQLKLRIKNTPLKGHSRGLLTSISVFSSLCVLQNDQSTEDMHIIGPDDLSMLKGKVLYQFFAIVDTGKTMRLKGEIRGGITLKHYDGFVIPNRFMVGYALDYSERPQCKFMSMKYQNSTVVVFWTGYRGT